MNVLCSWENVHSFWVTMCTSIHWASSSLLALLLIKFCSNGISALKTDAYAMISF